MSVLCKHATVCKCIKHSNLYILFVHITSNVIICAVFTPHLEKRWDVQQFQNPLDLAQSTGIES